MLLNSMYDIVLRHFDLLALLRVLKNKNLKNDMIYLTCMTVAIILQIRLILAVSGG